MVEVIAKRESLTERDAALHIGLLKWESLHNEVIGQVISPTN